MKKISIILASLFAAVLLASCAPVTSYTTTSEESSTEYNGYYADQTFTISVAEGDFKAGEISGYGFDTLPAEVTLTALEVEKDKVVSIKNGDYVVYTATTDKVLNKGDTLTLKINDGFIEEVFFEAYELTGGTVTVTVGAVE